MNEAPRVTAKLVRALYPFPCRQKKAREDSYCVGGALCRALGVNKDFPSHVALSEILRRANPQLSPLRAMDASLAIIVNNEDGNFSAAWARLEEVLPASSSAEEV